MFRFPAPPPVTAEVLLVNHLSRIQQRLYAVVLTKEDLSLKFVYLIQNNHKKIFGMFHQIESSKNEGQGLGLTHSSEKTWPAQWEYMARIWYTEFFEQLSVKNIHSATIRNLNIWGEFRGETELSLRFEDIIRSISTVKDHDIHIHIMFVFGAILSRIWYKMWRYPPSVQSNNKLRAGGGRDILLIKEIVMGYIKYIFVVSRLTKNSGKPFIMKFHFLGSMELAHE